MSTVRASGRSIETSPWSGGQLDVGRRELVLEAARRDDEVVPEGDALLVGGHAGVGVRAAVRRGRPRSSRWAARASPFHSARPFQVASAPPDADLAQRSGHAHGTAAGRRSRRSGAAAPVVGVRAGKSSRARSLPVAASWTRTCRTVLARDGGLGRRLGGGVGRAGRPASAADGRQRRHAPSGRADDGRAGGWQPGDEAHDGAARSAGTPTPAGRERARLPEGGLAARRLI